MTDFNPDGPHSPDLTKAAADQIAERVRYLAYAIRSGSGGLDLDAAYSLPGSLSEAAGRLPQPLAQVAGFLEAQAEAGRLRDDQGRDVSAQIALACLHLGVAGRMATDLAASLRSAQNAISGLSAKGDGDD